MAPAQIKIKQVVKRDGSRQAFELSKLKYSIAKAGEDTHEFTNGQAQPIIAKVLQQLERYPGREITTQQLRDWVETEIAKAGYIETARYYIIYGYEKNRRQPLDAKTKQAFAESKQYFRNSLAELVYYRTYSRWRDDLGRRETWPETVDRFMQFMRQTAGSKLSDKDYQRVHQALLQQKFVPSMRLLWAAGEAAAKNNVSAYNCSFVSPTRLRDFGEIMFLMMSGTGVGFSVEQHVVDQLPEVKPQTDRKLKTHVVKDSKAGWADALIAGLKAWWSGKDIEFDYSKIRPYGSRLKTMGGRAAGPEALRSVLTFARQLILSRQGKKLSTLDVHDLVCKIGEVVVAGGVRRSSLISLSDLDDGLMRDAKNGQFYIKHPQRAMANNSAVYNQKPGSVEFLQEWLNLAQSGSGERGIFNRGSLLEQLPARRLRKFKQHLTTCGSNPCGEIILRSRQFCNLTCIVVRPEDTVNSLLEKIELATIVGTFQAALTNFPYLDDDWRKNCEEEALLGVSFTGYWDNETIRKPHVLRKLRDWSVAVNQKYARKLGIKPSTAVTCVKPSGNSSQLLDTASGMHPRYAKYYVRRVRISAADPICQMLKDQGVPFHPEVGQDPETAKTLVFEFPIKSPKGAVTRNDLTAVELLEHWKSIKINFTEHNPSATIYVGDDEWLDVAHWVYQNWDIVGGLTFLPRNDHVYKLAPYEEIDRQTYERLASQVKEIDFSRIVAYEQEDQTEGAKELACVGGGCEI